ncbi:MAG TPA: (Fe-S)-binding protein [Desulforhopalus sp.]|nr:(Fe-S)-binding protein [Desulforhopalus sp.]
MIDNDSGACGRCGLCLAVCPVHRVLLEEQASPRARIQLIEAHQRGRLPSSPYLKELINRCLMCGSCAANCPSGIDHYSRFMAMRAKMVKEHGDRLEIRGLVYLLAREWRLRLAVGVARWGQNLVPESFQKRYQLAEIALQQLPALNQKAFRQTVPEVSPPQGEERGAVLYFTGCATNHIFAETGHATLRLLTALGYRVIIPAQQTCCSIPMLYHGGIAEARDNILQNIAALTDNGVEAVIVDCPTCGSALKKEFPKIIAQAGEDPQPALTIAEKVTDLLSFLYHRRDRLSTLLKICPDRVTYHAPCHLKNTFTPADRLLRALPGINFLPADNSLDCCGGGGTFFYEYPEIAGKLAAAKIAGARRSGARLWLTDCPVCRINLAGRLNQEDGLEVCHPAEYLSRLLVDRSS